jgi:hypothetical protein
MISCLSIEKDPKSWRALLSLGGSETRRTQPMPLLLCDTHNQGSPARKFRVWNFCLELQTEAQAMAFLLSGVVEEVDYVAAESIFQAAAFVEIERARRINFQLFQLAHHWAQLALKLQPARSYLRHG